MLAVLLVSSLAVPTFAGQITWVKRAPMQQALSGIAAAAWNGKIYVSGGTSGGPDVLKETRIYDPATDSWVMGPNMNTGRRFHGMVEFENTLYVVGGEDPSSMPIAGMWSVEKLNGSSYGYTYGMNTPRTELGCVVYNNRIWAIGGKDNTWITTNGAEQSDFGAMMWSGYISWMMSVRKNFAVAAGDNRIYALGGRDGMGYALSVAEYYNGATWNGMPNMHSLRDGGRAALWRGKLFVSGGMETSGGPNNTVEYYDPNSNSWTDTSPMPEVKVNHAMVVCNDRLYVIGGGDGGGQTNSMYEAIDLNLDRVKNGGITAMPNTVVAGSAGKIRFVIKGEGPNMPLEFYIYALSGRLVFERKDLTTDGSYLCVFEPELFDGKNSPIFTPGTYVAVVKSGSTVSKTGFMILPQKGSK